MAPFWEKGGILHLSYLLNESGDPNFFSFFYYVYIMKFNPGKFEKITYELPKHFLLFWQSIGIIQHERHGKLDNWGDVFKSIVSMSANTNI